MSYFTVALQRAAEQRQLSQAELAARSGLSRSYISRLLSGDHADLSDENFVALQKIFSGSVGVQAELVAARCMDVRVGPGAAIVDISIKHGGKAKAVEDPLPQVPLSKETERAFAWLRSQCPINPDLEKHLVGYAKLTGMK